MDNECLKKRLDSIDWSAKTLNLFKRMHIEFFWELVEKTDYELLSVTSLGIKTLNEIKEKIHFLGIDKPIPYPDKNNISTSIDNETDDINQKILTENQIKLLIFPLKEIVWSSRANNLIKRLNLNYVWELAEKKEKELIEYKNIGKNTIDEINNKLIEYGSYKLGATFSDEEKILFNKYIDILSPNEFNHCHDVVYNIDDIYNYFFSRLKQKQKDIVTKRWFNKTTFEEIGIEFGLTRERIRQIVNNSHDKFFSQNKIIIKHYQYVLNSDLDKNKGEVSLLTFANYFIGNIDYINHFISLLCERIQHVNIVDGYITFFEKNEKYKDAVKEINNCIKNISLPINILELFTILSGLPESFIMRYLFKKYDPVIDGNAIVTFNKASLDLMVSISHKIFNKPFTIKEIQDEICRLFHRDLSIDAIRKVLNDCKEITIINRGLYKRKNQFNISPNFIKENEY